LRRGRQLLRRESSSTHLLEKSSTYVNKKKTLEVFVGVRNEVLSIRSKDTAISIVDVGTDGQNLVPHPDKDFQGLLFVDVSGG
jgi:hypothetical protein